MELLQQVVANLEIDENKAEKGIGAILTALRMSSGKEPFEHVKAAVPNAERMMGHALMSGARTAELAAPVGPAGDVSARAARRPPRGRWPGPGPAGRWPLATPPRAPAASLVL